MDFYKGNIPIIDHTPEAMAYAMPLKLEGERVGYGYVPRDFSVHPEQMFDPPSGIPIIPQSEWDARYDEQERTKSSLEHLYLSGAGGNPIFENLDQNGQGYCWAYSTTSAVMLLRAKAGQPLVRLSAHAIGCKVKNFRDEGGWCGLSAKFHRDQGCPSVEHWPEKSMSRSHDNAATWENAALHKITEDWVDLTREVYDQNLSDQAAATCTFYNVPVPSDYPWWSHSVCRIRRVRIEAGSWGDLILNSWKGWGRHGLGVIRGDKMRTAGAVALRVTGASVV